MIRTRVESQNAKTTKWTETKKDMKRRKQKEFQMTPRTPPPRDTQPTWQATNQLCSSHLPFPFTFHRPIPPHTSILSRPRQPLTNHSTVDQACSVTSRVPSWLQKSTIDNAWTYLAGVSPGQYTPSGTETKANNSR